MSESITAVIGAGTMGHGIAQIFALAGHSVRLFDQHPGVLASARERIGANLELLIERGLLGASEAEQALSLVTFRDTAEAAVEGVGLVIEAVYEDLALKHKVLAQIEAACPREAIIASNTSNYRVGQLAPALQHAERFLVTHFFSPPYIVPLVEVVPGQSTSEATVCRVTALLRAAGKRPALVRRDVAGFVGNRLQHALRREAIALVDQGVASAEDIDLIARLSFGLRLPVTGPLETADLGGLDLSLAIQSSLLPELDRSSEPTETLRRKVERGELGAKAGRGFFAWTDESHARRVRRRDSALLDLLALVAAYDEGEPPPRSADEERGAA
jgi:3-hydroxybutyryl-CoA dehydrogenase